jgi:hypothetical protein
MQRPWLRKLLRAPIWLYRARLGFLLGHRFVYVAHRGLAKLLGVPIDAALHGRVDPAVSLPAVRFTPS